jgi:hypothetical protein
MYHKLFWLKVDEDMNLFDSKWNKSLRSNQSEKCLTKTKNNLKGSYRNKD